MFEPLLIKPLIALLLVAISCGLLGVLVLWKKLAYFGDALSHSILLGIFAGTLLNSNQILSLIIFALIFAILLQTIIENDYFSKDSIIAILSYFFIALALILNDFLGKNFDFSSAIFGDILTINFPDILMLSAITITTIIFTFFAYKKILLISINSDLALVRGLKNNRWNISFIILLTITIALSVKIIGIFLMTAFLILPAAIARLICSSAKSMLLYSLAISCATSIGAFEISDVLNLNISSSLIGILSLVFMLIILTKKYGKL